MARILLEIGADASQAEQELQKMAGKFSAVSSVSKKTQQETKKGFEDVASSAKKANEEIANPKPTQQQVKNISALQQLKAEIKAYEAAALKAGEGTKEFAEAIAKAGEKKAELKDLKEAIAALDPDGVAKSFLGLTSSIAGGFAIAQGAIALTGEKSEDLEKALLKVQAAQAILSGLQQVSNIQDELGKVKIIALQKIATAQIQLQGAAESKNIVIRGAAVVAQRALNAAMSIGAGGVIAVIGGVIALGVALSKLSGHQETATELQERLNKEFERTKSTLDSQAALQDSYVELLRAQGKSQEEIDKAEKQSFDLKKQRIEEEIKLKTELINKNQEELEQKFGGRSESGLLISERKELEASRNVIADLNNERSNLIAESSKLVIDENIKELKNEKEKADELKRLREQELENRKQFLQAVRDLEAKVSQAEIEQLTGEAKIKAIESRQIYELELYKQAFLEKTKQQKLTLEQEQQFFALENAIRLKATQDILEIQKNESEQLAEEIKAGYQKTIAAREKAFTDELTAIENHQRALVLQTKEGTPERIQAEIEEIEKIAAFRKTQANLSTDEIIIIEREALEKIDALRRQYAETNKFSWAKLFGVTDQEFDEIKAGLEKIYDLSRDLIGKQLEAEQEALDERKKMNDDEIKERDKNIADLQKKLELELQLNAQGFASDVDLLRSKLAQEEEAKKIALEEEKRISQAQEEIKRKQAALDAVNQASQLLSAGATLLATGATAGPAGIIAAVATIAAMVAAFIALKAKIEAAAGFKEGGYTGDVGENETAGVVHGKEFVSTAKTTRKYRPLLEAMHTENFSGLQPADLAPIIEAVQFNPGVLNQIEQERIVFNNNRDSRSRELVDTMKATNKNLAAFFNHVRNKPTETTNMRGDKIIKKGNMTRVIKKK